MSIAVSLHLSMQNTYTKSDLDGGIKDAAFIVASSPSRVASRSSLLAKNRCKSRVPRTKSLKRNFVRIASFRPLRSLAPEVMRAFDTPGRGEHLINFASVSIIENARVHIYTHIYTYIHKIHRKRGEDRSRKTSRDRLMALTLLLARWRGTRRGGRNLFETKTDAPLDNTPNTGEDGNDGGRKRRREARGRKHRVCERRV